jgi:hypothetical protein
VIERERKR